MRRLSILQLCFVVLFLSAKAYSLGPYYVTDIGSLPGGDGTGWARDVNSLGQVVGSAVTPQGERAFLWQPDAANGTTGEIFALEGLPINENTYAFALNDYGQVVGRTDATSGKRAFLWQPEAPNSTSGAPFGLGQLPGGSDYSNANGINSRGQVVGYIEAATGLRAFLWQPTTDNGAVGSLIDLGDLPGGEDYSIAHDINDAGLVVGQSWAADERRPFAWIPTTSNDGVGTMVDLGDLPGGYEEGGAIGVSNAGQVVGHSSATSGFRGFLTNLDATGPEASELVDLGDLPGEDDYSLARDINAHGQIVGVGTLNGQRAATWTAPDQIIDLNDLLDPISGSGWTLNYASGINDFGQIVGYGYLYGIRRGFLLTPVPVPSPASISLAVLQVGVLVVCSRRRLSADHL